MGKDATQQKGPGRARAFCQPHRKMQQHIRYLEHQIASLELKCKLLQFDTKQECSLLRDLVNLAKYHDSLKCHMASLTPDLLERLMRRFLIDSEILALALCTKVLHRHFYRVYLELVGPRRRDGPITVAGIHARHFWYTIPRRQHRHSQQFQRLPDVDMRIDERPGTTLDINPLARLHSVPSTTPSVPIHKTMKTVNARAVRKASTYTGCNRCHKDGHFVHQCPVPCSLCSKSGHTEKMCPMRNIKVIH
jgi:hypothetical protein